MKATVFRRFRCIALIITLVVCLMISCLCGCSNKPTEPRVSAMKLAELREEFPYNDTLPPTAFVSYERLQTWQQLNSVIDVYAVAVIELKGDWSTATTGSTTFKDVPYDELPEQLRTIAGTFRSAIVEQVLWGGKNLEKGDRITLFFGGMAMCPIEDLELTYQEKQRYVCFLYDYRENPYQIPAFSIEKESTWHLADKDVLVSACSFISCIDECSGMYLNAFEQELTAYLGPPDAELTPVEPELETE